MKRVLIIEDETAAAVNLKALLGEQEPNMTVVANIESVAEAIEWFGSNPMPDLVFMDIHLADGNAFTIFRHTDITCPIIFTTAYDQYALDAFKVNSIDYLLKPIKGDDLRRAIEKLSLLEGSSNGNNKEQLLNLAESQEHIRSLLVQIRDRIIPLSIEQIAYLYSSNERSSVCSVDGCKYPLTKSLDNFASLLPQESFFRANRQFIVSRRAVKDISVWFGSKLAVNLNVETPERIIVSKAKAGEFKQWIAGKSNQ